MATDRRQRKIERLQKRLFSLSDLDKQMDYSFIGFPTKSGVKVNEVTVFNYGTAYACIRLTAQAMASLPLHLYQRKEKGKEKAESHPLYNILHREPNPEMTAFQLMETLMGHLLTWGNSYCEIEYDRLNRVKGLWPLRPDRVKPFRDDRGELWYELKMSDGEPIHLPAYRVLHTSGLGFNGLVGYSPITLAKDIIGLGLAAEEMGSRLFANDMRPSLVLVHPGSLSKDAKENIKEGWQDAYGGLKNKHRMALLDEGVDIKVLGFEPEAAQFLETRKFQVEEMCRFFGTPPNLVGHTEPTTSWGTGLESINLGWKTYCLQGWAERHEQNYFRKLLTPQEKLSYFFKFNFEAFLRPDAKTRAEALQIQMMNSAVNADEWREIENRNPLPDGLGQIYYMPANMIPVDKEEPEPIIQPPIPMNEEPEEDTEEEDKRSLNVVETRDRKRIVLGRYRLQKAYHPLFKDAARRAIKREVQDLKRINKKTNTYLEFESEMKAYLAEHKDIYRDTLGPVFWSYAEVINEDSAREVGTEPGYPGRQKEAEDCIRLHIDKTTDYHIGQLSGRLSKFVDPTRAVSDYQELLDEELDEILLTVPALVADWEATRTNGLVTKATFAVADVKGMEWVKMDDSELCKMLDRITVEVDERNCNKYPFYEKAKRSLDLRSWEDFTPSWIVATPPLWCGCTCQIKALI